MGKHDSSEPAVLLQDLDYFTGSDLKTETTMKDNLGNTQYNCFYVKSATNVYKLNGQYTKMSGTLFQLYDYRSKSSYESTVEIYGDGKLLYTATVSGGIEPIDFSVDLTGVLELTVKTGRSTQWGENSGGLHCGLYT